MEYQEVINFLYEQLPVYQNKGAGAYKPGLRTAVDLSAAFGNPHKGLRCIHVAGTNGKGSTSHSIASVLMAAGYKVGLYTSPHLVDFRERIRVDGKMIDEASVVDFVERYLSMHLNLEPSFFELTTIMAFEYFAKSKVDFAVIEVGLGGRLDTTNIITPILSVITNVSLEHTALLGSTIEQIANEKAGIIKPGVPVVIGEAAQTEREVFERIAAERGSRVVFAQDTPVSCERNGETYMYSRHEGESVCIASDLCGDFQPKNANTVLHALDFLPVDLHTIQAGMAQVASQTGLMGRWMQLCTSPTVVADAGHNPGAWAYLAPRLNQIAKERNTHLVLGFSNDKDVDSIFKMLPKQAHYYFVTASVERSFASSHLLEVAKEHGFDACAFYTVAEGYKAALRNAADGEFVFVGGSFFVISDLINAIK